MVLVSIPFFYLQAEDTIGIYLMSYDEMEGVNRLKTYLENKGFVLNIYKKATTLEGHIENANRINRSKVNLVLALDLKISEKERFFVAHTNAKPTTENILSIEEIPGRYVERSRELASCVASFFGKTSKEMPLFFLLGVDVPGIFISIDYTKEHLSDIFNRLDSCLKHFFRRDTEHEG